MTLLAFFYVLFCVVFVCGFLLLLSIFSLNFRKNKLCICKVFPISRKLTPRNWVSIRMTVLFNFVQSFEIDAHNLSSIYALVGKKLKFKSYIELIFIIIRLKQFTLLYKLLRIHTSYIPFCFMLQAICKHSFFNNSSTSCNFNLF